MDASLEHMKKHLSKGLVWLAFMLFCLPVNGQEEWRYTQNWFQTGYYEQPENVFASPVPQSLSEAVQLLPPIPTVEQVMSPNAKTRIAATVYEPFSLAVEQAMTQYIDANIIIQRRINEARMKQEQREQRAVQQNQFSVRAALIPSSQEMIQMVMDGEIDPNWSDDKITNFLALKLSSKWGITRQEYLKITKMAQKDDAQANAYVENNMPELYERIKAATASDESLYQPDPRDERFARIAQAIEDIEPELTRVVLAYNGSGAGGYASHTHSPAFDKLLAELRHDWYTCDEAKHVEEIEDALDIRIEKWMATLTDNVRNEVPFPLWWEAERRKENVYIDQWNRRAAERWLKVAQDGENKIKGVFEKLAALETENERLAEQGDPEHVVYLSNKLRLNNYMAQLYRITEPYQDALWFPCIEHVVTSGSARLK